MFYLTIINKYKEIHERTQKNEEKNPLQHQD